MGERFETHSRTVALLTMTSRVTGLARDATLARIFGAGLIADAFFFAFMVPNLFRRLFGEGALAAAFVPVYAQLSRDDPTVARRLATLTMGFLAAGLGGITVLGELGLLAIVRWADHEILALQLLMIMLPYMPLVCVVAMLGAMLQVHGRFGPSAAAPIVLNAALITTAAATEWWWTDVDDHARIAAVSASILVAGLLQVAWMLWALRGCSWPRRDLRRAAGPFRRMLKQAGPMVMGLGVLQLNTFVDGVIASYPTAVGPTLFGLAYPLEAGAMAAVSFAQRLYQFPLGVFGLAVATAIFPALARVADDDPAFGDLVRRGLRLVVFIGLPASAGLMLVGPQLSTVILQGGHFSAADSQRVAFILFGYAAAVWAYSMVHVLTRAFYAKGDARGPVRIAVAMVVLNLALNCTLIWTPLREAGLAWSTAICSILQAALLLVRLRRRAPHAGGRDVSASWLRTAALTGGMVLVVGLTRTMLPHTESWWPSVVNLTVLVGVGLAAVAGAARVLGMPELRWALGRS